MSDLSNLGWFGVGLRQAHQGGVEYAYVHPMMEPDDAYAHWLANERVEGWIDVFNAAQQGAIRDAFMQSWNAWAAREVILANLPAANCNEVPERKAQ